MNHLEYGTFIKKFTVLKYSSLLSQMLHDSATLILPKHAIIHFIPENNNLVGIDMSNTLLRNNEARIPVYHVIKLLHENGNPSHLSVVTTSLIREYHKRNSNMINSVNLDKEVRISNSVIVVNYGILNRMYKYRTDAMSVYWEWLNIRNTMWDTIIDMPSDKMHFVRYLLPSVLPSKIELNTYSEKMVGSGIKIFNSIEDFDILELWRIINHSTLSPLDRIPDGILDNIHLVFVESGKVIILRLGELCEWVDNDPDRNSVILYNFLDRMIRLRTPITLPLETNDVGDVIVASSDQVTTTNTPGVKNVNEKTALMIDELSLAGRLTPAEKKMLLKISEKSMSLPDPINPDLTIGEVIVTDKDLILDNDNIVPDHQSILDKSMLKSRIKEYTRKYATEIYHKDVMATLVQLQGLGFLIKGINVKVINTAVTEALEYSINVQPLSGVASTIVIKIPHIKPNGTFKSGNINYRMKMQTGEMPIAKIKPYQVALTSYAGKVFVTRNQNSVSNLAKWFHRRIMLNSSDGVNSRITNVLTSKIEVIDTHIPRAYTAIAETFSSFTIGDIVFYWRIGKTNTVFSKEELDTLKELELTVCGRNKTSIIGMDVAGNIFSIKGKDKVSLGHIANVIDPDNDSMPREYSEISIFSRRVPLVIAFSYMYGLDETLKMIGVKYEIVSSSQRVAHEDNKYHLKFRDLTYIITLANQEQSLVIAGWNAASKNIRLYKANDFSRPNVYHSLLSSSSVSSLHFKELKILWDMFIDHITFGLLKTMKEPTEFGALLLRANELLVNDYAPEYIESRIKGYERISGFIHSELVRSVRAYRSQNSLSNASLGMNPNAVWLGVLQDPSIAIIEELSPLHNLKETETVTVSGAGGRSSVTMVKETRGFEPNDLGVRSEASPDSGNTGMITYLTGDPNLTSMRGTTRKYDKLLDSATNCLSTTSLLSPGISHDDAKRVNHINVQYSHTVPCVNYKAIPYRTGFESIVAARTDPIFAVAATGDGKISAVTKDTVTVKYDSGQEVSYELGIIHGIASGATIPHNVITDMVIGDKVSKGHVIAYNDGFFERHRFNKAAVIYKIGVIGRIAFLENNGTIEDGNVLTEEMASRLTTPTTKVYTLILDNNYTISNLVKVGDKVDPESILCTTSNNINGEQIDDESIGALVKISSNNPKAKMYGVISKLETFYFCDKNDLNPSLLGVVELTDGYRKKKANAISGNIAKTGRINEIIQVGGKKILEGQMVLKIYIDGEIPLGTGDKVVFANGLKSTVSRVETNPMVTVGDGLPVDGMFGYISVSARIVISPEIMGPMITILRAASIKAAKIYFGLDK